MTSEESAGVIRLYCEECDFEREYVDAPDDPWTEGAMAHGMSTGHNWQIERVGEMADDESGSGA